MIRSIEDFKRLVDEVKGQDGYRDPIAFDIARVDRGQKNADKVLQANFPLINWNENYGSGAVFIQGSSKMQVSVWTSPKVSL